MLKMLQEIEKNSVYRRGGGRGGAEGGVYYCFIYCVSQPLTVAKKIGCYVMSDFLVNFFRACTFRKNETGS